MGRVSRSPANGKIPLANLDSSSIVDSKQAFSTLQREHSTKGYITTANSLNLPTLKEEQRRVAKALLEGKDVLGILPTGFGKSFIFQVFVKAKSRGSRDLDCL